MSPLSLYRKIMNEARDVCMYVCVCLCVGRVPFSFASVVAALANGPQGELGVPSATAIS